MRIIEQINRSEAATLKVISTLPDQQRSVYIGTSADISPSAIGHRHLRRLSGALRRCDDQSVRQDLALMAQYLTVIQFQFRRFVCVES